MFLAEWGPLERKKKTHCKNFSAVVVVGNVGTENELIWTVCLPLKKLFASKQLEPLFFIQKWWGLDLWYIAVDIVKYDFFFFFSFARLQKLPGLKK